MTTQNLEQRNTQTRTPVIELINVDKSFGTTDVLNDISLKVHPGEVLCLLGDNGAGKSTVIKILSGFHEPTRGTMKVNGKEVSFTSPRDASDLGISTVHQFGGTFPLMTIARSFFVGLEPVKGFWPLKKFDRKFAGEVAVKEMQALGITRITDGDRLVGGLSGGERQALAIGRAVYFGANVLILDEPTAALGVKEATHVLRIIHQARQRGLAVILVTHNVTHAMSVGDHFAVLIHGALAADFRKGERTREEITDLMAGGEAMAELEAEIEAYQAAHEGQAPSPEELERLVKDDDPTS
jgi:simple sugar transport system ATP-binding protein